MDASVFCMELADRISPDEWWALERAGSGLFINEHNRGALLEMRDVAHGGHAGSGCADAPSVDIDATAAAKLEGEIQAYLDEYMADNPEGHKWIILASLYLTFVAKRPMHPIERAGVVVESVGGRTVYLCPSKVPGDNPICDSCVCMPMETRDSGRP